MHLARARSSFLIAGGLAFVPLVTGLVSLVIENEYLRVDHRSALDHLPFLMLGFAAFWLLRSSRATPLERMTRAAALVTAVDLLWRLRQIVSGHEVAIGLPFVTILSTSFLAWALVATEERDRRALRIAFTVGVLGFLSTAIEWLFHRFDVGEVVARRLLPPLGGLSQFVVLLTLAWLARKHLVLPAADTSPVVRALRSIAMMKRVRALALSLLIAATLLEHFSNGSGFAQIGRASLSLAAISIGTGAIFFLATWRLRGALKGVATFAFVLELLRGVANALLVLFAILSAGRSVSGRDARDLVTIVLVSVFLSGVNEGVLLTAARRVAIVPGRARLLAWLGSGSWLLITLVLIALSSESHSAERFATWAILVISAFAMAIPFRTVSVIEKTADLSVTTADGVLPSGAAT